MQARSFLITLVTALIGATFVWYLWHQGATKPDLSFIPTSTPVLPDIATTTATSSQTTATTTATSTQ